MRRFLVFLAFLCVTVPFGASVAGCGSKTAAVRYCPGNPTNDSGPSAGQVAQITLSPTYATYGLSLDFAQIGPALSASAVDCFGATVSVRAFTYATSNMSFADINPSNGEVCGGTWNRNSGGGIADFTTCSAPTTLATPASPLAPTVAYVTATASGATSNAIPVYIHPIVTSVVIGTPTGGYPISSYTIGAGATTFATSVTPPAVGTSVSLSNFATSTFLDGQTVTVTSVGATTFSVASAFGKAAQSTVTESGVATNPLACSTTTDPSTNCCPSFIVTASAAPVTGNSCLSQGTSGQLTARVYQNSSTTPANNITCRVGHVSFAGQNSAIFTVDQNGVATAQQPGSTIVTASLTNSGTGGAAGFFATCPPASITLTANGQAGVSPVPVGLNNTQPLTATVIDTKGVTLVGTQLTYLSTTPTTIPASSGIVAPTFPGAATITAECQPPTCNPAPFSQIGLFGNGKPITSNGVQVTTAGTNASVIYVGSTQSQYILPVDFSTGLQGALVKLPYVPNSMVITQDGSTIYLGSTTALMTVSATTNAVGGANVSIPGPVLAVSPDGATVVVTDPIRQTVSLVVNGSVSTSYGGVGTHAQWTPDSSTVYITTSSNVLLEHSTFTGWNATPTTQQYSDLAVAVPSVGAFFSGPTTQGRSYCSTTTVGATGNPPVETNAFYPIASDTAAQTDHLAATNDGGHVLGVTATPALNLADIAVSVGANTPVTSGQPNGPLTCTTATSQVLFNTSLTNHPLAGITATAVNGVVPSSNSAVAFITYSGTGGQLPLYVPATGALNNVALSGGATTAPINGVFSTDNKTFFATTSGDNAVHLISVNGTAATDVPASVITPKLPDGNGNTVVPNLIVQRPKKATS